MKCPKLSLVGEMFGSLKTTNDYTNYREMRDYWAVTLKKADNNDEKTRRKITLEEEKTSAVEYNAPSFLLKQAMIFQYY